MKEFDINEIWQQGGREADHYYTEIKDQVLEMARKRSQGVLDKVKRFGMWEFILGAILWTFLLSFFWSKPNGFWLLTILAAATFGFSAKLYQSMLRKIQDVNSLDTRGAIQQYISILSSYHNRVANYVSWGTIIGFFAGLVAGLISDLEEMWEKVTDWMFWGVILVCLVIVYFLARYLKSWYLEYSIGKFIDELKAILVSLEEG